MFRPSKTEDRDLKLFKLWLKGSSVEEIAKQGDVSVGQVYRIARLRKWSRYADQREHRKYKLAFEEVEQEGKTSAKAIELVEHMGRKGEWVESELRFPKSRISAPGAFFRPDPNIEVIEINLAEGYVRKRVFFPGGWQSPFRKKAGAD